MSFQRVRSQYFYTCLSADVKQTSNPVPPSGAELLELDTGAEFYWDGSTWRQINVRIPDLQTPINLTAATAELIILTPTAGKAYRVLGLMFTPSSATLWTMNIRTTDINGAITKTLTLGSGSNVALNLTNREAFGKGWVIPAGSVLALSRTVSTPINGYLLGVEE